MHKALILVLLCVILVPIVVHAEGASVLFDLYQIPFVDAQVEEERLRLLEEEHYSAIQRVNKNTMLSAAMEVFEEYKQRTLMNMDLEMYHLADDLHAIELQMDRSKNREVTYILELDSKYREVLAELEAKRELRNVWSEQQGELLTLKLDNVEQDRRMMDTLGRQVEKQIDKYLEAKSCAELGEVTSFRSPLEIPVRLTSPFGLRLDPITRDKMTFHYGMDMHAPENTLVLAAFHGFVEEASTSAGLGNYIIINHGCGIKTLYGHLNNFYVAKDQSIRQYDPIARSGSTGVRTTGPHLHFSLYIHGKAVDPAVFLSYE